MFRYFFWLLIVTLLLFISYHLIPALHVYITDRNLKYIRRYRGFMDDDVFHIPPELEPSHPFREWLERDNRPARGAEPSPGLSQKIGVFHPSSRNEVWSFPN